MLRTLEQNKRLWSLSNSLHLDAEGLKEYVLKYSHNRTASSKALTIPECQALINELDALKKSLTNAPISNNDASQRMRRKIMSICHEMNWTEAGKLDWKRINGFMLNSSYLKKAINAYTSQELPKLVSQFEQLLKSHYAKG